MTTMTISEFADYRGTHRPGIYNAIALGKLDCVYTPFPRGKTKVNGVTCRKEIVVNEKAEKWQPGIENDKRGKNYEQEMPNGVTYYGTFGMMCAEFNMPTNTRVPEGRVKTKSYRKKGRTYFFAA